MTDAAQPKKPVPANRSQCPTVATQPRTKLIKGEPVRCGGIA